MTVLEWNAKLLPEDFRKTTNEPELLKLVNFHYPLFVKGFKKLHMAINKLHNYVLGI